MRLSSLAIVSLLFCGVFGLLNYNGQNPSDTCNLIPNQNSYPVNLQTVGCSPFGTFNLTLPNITNQKPVVNTTINNLVLNINGNLDFNGTNFTATQLAFHSPSENLIDGVQGDLEMQIYLTSGTNSIAAVLSFIFQNPWSELNNNINNVNETLGRLLALNLPQNNIVSNLSSTNWTVSLGLLANNINNKYVNDTFLNMYTFNSTLNFNDSSIECNNVQWFVYGGGLYVTNQTLLGFANAISNANIGITPNTSTPSPSGNGFNYAGNYLFNASNNVTATKMCFSGYFLVTMNSNYGLWFAWGLTVLFFVITLILDEKPMKNVDYVESAWTHHPLYSIAVVGNDFFTRKSRCASVLVQIINQFVWNSVFYLSAFQATGTPTTADLFINPAISMAIGWGVLYFIGIFLRLFYLKKAEYNASNEADREEKNDRAQLFIYIYYFFVFVLVAVGFSFTIANLDQVQSYNNPTTANMWVASVFIGLGYDWLILDIIVCGLAVSMESLRGLFRWKGYLYDKVCHDSYLAAIKRE